MPKTLLRSLVLISAILSSGLAQAATTAPSSFTEAQQTQIQDIVHQYLVTHPEVLIEAVHSLQSRQQQHMQVRAKTAIDQRYQELFNAPSSPVVGNPKGAITVVEFFDFQCPYCKRIAPMLQQVIKNNPDVRLVFKQLPIFGDPSDYAARAALAVNEQNPSKYFAFQNALLEVRAPFTRAQILSVADSLGINSKQLAATLEQKTFSAELEANHSLANDLGLEGTPAFVVAKVTLNNNKVEPPRTGSFIPGAVDLTTLQQAIDQARKS